MVGRGTIQPVRLAFVTPEQQQCWRHYSHPKICRAKAKIPGGFTAPWGSWGPFQVSAALPVTPQLLGSHLRSASASPRGGPKALEGTRLQSPLSEMCCSRVRETRNDSPHLFCTECGNTNHFRMRGRRDRKRRNERQNERKVKQPEMPLGDWWAQLQPFNSEFPFQASLENFLSSCENLELDEMCCHLSLWSTYQKYIYGELVFPPKVSIFRWSLHK